MKKHSLLSILVLLIIASCTVQKRHYRKGYEVTFNNAKNNERKKAVTDNRDVVSSKIDEQTISNQHDESPLSASTENKIVTKDISSKHNLLSLARRVNLDDTCDLILLRNGNIANAKILEINTTDIKYKNCNNQDGPLIIIDKNSVKSITYKNGFTEEFAFVTPPNTSKPQPQTNTNRRTSSSGEYDGYSIGSLVCGVLSIFLFPALPAIILGIIGIKKTKENGTKGYAMAIAGIVLGSIVIALFLLAMVAIALAI